MTCLYEQVVSYFVNGLSIHTLCIYLREHTIKNSVPLDELTDIQKLISGQAKLWTKLWVMNIPNRMNDLAYTTIQYRSEQSTDVSEGGSWGTLQVWILALILSSHAALERCSTSLFLSVLFCKIGLS